MPIAKPKPASKAILRFLDSLLIDCGFNTLTQRNAYLSRETARDIEHLEDLQMREAIAIVDELKNRKERNKPPSRDDREEDPYED